MNKKPLLILAPLAGYTNIAYRSFMKEFGFDIVVSEMISDFALIYSNQETFKMVETSSEEKPVAIQLFGGNKDTLIKAEQILNKISNYDYLDVNLGCPVQKVVKNNAGSSWLKNDRQEELYLMMRELCEKSQKPVTAKIRLGWDKDSINVIETCKLLEKAGVKLIVIHGRTKSQLYSGQGDYEWIKKAKDAVSIPIIANGDINSLSKAIEVLDYTKADGIALGRGALGNPYLATQIKTYFETGEILPSSTIQMQIDYLKKHYVALEKLKGEYIAIREMRGISSWYLKGFSHVRDYKVAFSTINSSKDLYEICQNILKDDKIERV